MNKYRIQTREFSPDVIEINRGTDKKPNWQVCLAPIGGRHESIAHEICEWLNEKENELNQMY